MLVTFYFLMLAIIPTFLTVLFCFDSTFNLENLKFGSLVLLFGKNSHCDYYLIIKKVTLIKYFINYKN